MPIDILGASVQSDTLCSSSVQQEALDMSGAFAWWFCLEVYIVQHFCLMGFRKWSYYLDICKLGSV